MNFLEQIKINKYNKIIEEINLLNEQNAKGYENFVEYIYADEQLFNYFYQLKELERKAKTLTVESKESFEFKIFNQLNNAYSNCLDKIFINYSGDSRLVELENLKSEISSGVGHKCDKFIKLLLEDLNTKIRDFDKYIYEKDANPPLNYNEDNSDNYDDPLYNEIANYVIETGAASASLIQRKYRLGYNRAARLIDLLEENGVVGPPNGAKPRDVLITNQTSLYIVTTKNIKKIDEQESELEASEYYSIDYLKELMKKYEIDIEYETNKCDCKNIKNTLILNHDSIVEKQELVKMILKYNAPDKVKLMLFDSNKLCFKNLNGIPNLLCPVITDYNKMSVGLKNIACEMERRYDLFVENKVKSYEEYNNKTNLKSLPYIILIVDELYNIINNKDNYEVLVKLLLNGEQSGIKCIFYSKFSKRNLPLTTIDDLLNIYNKYNIDEIISPTTPRRDDIEIIDNEMDGFDFENYTADLLKNNGFNKITVTQSSGDFGVDVIAFKDDIKYAIQCKKYSSNVGIKAVQEVIASKVMNDCHVAVVLTNNYFTQSAIKLAEKNNVLLWDRDKLSSMIKNKI